MTTTGNNIDKPSEEPGELLIDLALLRRVTTECRRSLALSGLSLFAVALLALLLLLPQTFTSTASVALQQPSVSGLSSLLGLGNNTSNRYLGVLRSRSIAAKVAERVHLKELYRYRTKTQTVNTMQKSVRVENNPGDGLVYIAVTLQGPSRFGPGAAARRNKIERLTAAVANLYVKGLREYMRDADTDKDAVLIREAADKVRRARRDYDDAFALMATFVRSRRVGVGAGAPEQFGASAGSQTALAQLNALKMKQDQLAVDIRSDEAADSSVGRLLSGDVTTMQTEDPLLKQARGDVVDARITLNNLSIQYGDANPHIVVAKARLQMAEDRLRKEQMAIRAGRSSDAVKLDRLRAEFDMVSRQLAVADQEYRYGRVTGTDYERLRSEVDIRLKALEAAFTQYEQLSLQTVAAQNRISVVDVAEPAETGTPSLTLMALFSAVLALVFVLLKLTSSYLRASADAAKTHRALEIVRE